MRNLILVPVLLHVTASTSLGQRFADRVAVANRPQLETSTPVASRRQLQHEESRTGTMVAGGIAGALFFGAAGGYLGYHAAKNYAQGCSTDDWCELGGVLTGILVGEAFGVPLGVRVVGGSGSLPLQMLVSAGVLTLGVIAAPLTGGLALLAVVPVQLHLVVKNAKATATTSAPEALRDP